MSLFIATLAFGEGALLDLSKIGILAASLAAGVCGSALLLRRTGHSHERLASNSG
jgi:Na+/H+ antiporter NhaA